VKPASSPVDVPQQRREQEQEEESAIVDLRKMPRNDLPFDGFPRAARSLAEAARDHVAAGDLREARRAAEDALLVIDTIADSRAHGEVCLVLGDVLLALSEAHRARERFAAAVNVFDAGNDLPAAARARMGLARAMLMLRDPAARAVLEDAGTIFEEIGDERAVRAVDRALREADADLEGCPSSFHVQIRYVSAG
jgi:hypothetical protein